MTAEIAVFNKSAVSLAADSAVTIAGSEGVNKIYNGADKLFALSKNHPVGIMVFGTASLCGIPWEMIIKQFRKEIPSEGFDTIEQYAEAFFSFLCESENIIPMDIRENYLTNTYNHRFFPALINHIESKKIKPLIDEGGEIPSISDTYILLEEGCREVLAGLVEGEYLEGMDEKDIVESRVFAEPIAISICDERLLKEDNIPIPDSLYGVIADLFSYITCKKSPFGHNTGLVFAGYGEKEFMPAILAFDVLGFFKSKLRFSPNISKSSSGGDSGVVAYAQEDEVETFLHGISKSLKKFMYGGFSAEDEKLLSDLSEEIKQSELSVEQQGALIQKVDELISGRYDRFTRVINEHISEKFSSKVTEMIEFLPKQDLAYMAESLVNLTAFKRKVSNDNETVGGPIDVAIISKGDGFIWVKRKHYFDKDLNNHYFSRIS
ncbi:hypothetical protein [Rahnella sp. CJA17(1/100)]|uniref:hypothetical protein n=1 Tax=Rahnella sp. CJA17(1/100) TaxID=2508951 RepID=UPI00106F1D10|nr:hypothetical protein [Rahnella sp. CJA17(1/100)]